MRWVTIECDWIMINIEQNLVVSNKDNRRVGPTPCKICKVKVWWILGLHALDKHFHNGGDCYGVTMLRHFTQEKHTG